jgi:hypothetical protein
LGRFRVDFVLGKTCFLGGAAATTDGAGDTGGWLLPGYSGARVWVSSTGVGMFQALIATLREEVQRLVMAGDRVAFSSSLPKVFVWSVD